MDSRQRGLFRTDGLGRSVGNVDVWPSFAKRTTSQRNGIFAVV
ncbi:MAG TPA: hypothetical protein VF865_13280 [Acidobacteriaceae bacterium]